MPVLGPAALLLGAVAWGALWGYRAGYRAGAERMAERANRLLSHRREKDDERA